MSVSREKIRDLVEIFYQPTFKTFYVSGTSGSRFTRPTGVFVSLGITTSPRTLDEIRRLIESTGGYTAVLAEICTTKVSGQYHNVLVEKDNPGQYDVDSLDGVMSREEAKEELERLSSAMSPKQELHILKMVAPRVSKLQDLIEKLDGSDGWSNHGIMYESVKGEYKIFHKKVNYKLASDGKEYRFGIYVTEKECD